MIELKLYTMKEKEPADGTAFILIHSDLSGGTMVTRDGDDLLDCEGYEIDRDSIYANMDYIRQTTDLWIELPPQFTWFKETINQLRNSFFRKETELSMKELTTQAQVSKTFGNDEDED